VPIDEITKALQEAHEATRDHPGHVDVTLTLRRDDDGWQLRDSEVIRWVSQQTRDAA